MASRAPRLQIERRVTLDEEGKELPETEGYVVVDGIGHVIAGPFKTFEEARKALKKLTAGPRPF